MKKFCSKEGEIAYVVKGSGPRHFLLVHNSGGNHEMMHHTADYFSRGGKVVIPDLLGHGSSASPKIDYTLNFFAESLLELCEIEKLSQVVFVGLNYGADIGIVLAQMAPTLISHLVLIEPPVFMESWIRKVVEQQMKDLEHPQEAWAQETVDTVILKASAQDREIALRALKKTPAFVKISTFKHLLEWDQEGGRKQSFLCSIPTLLIQTSQPFCTEEKARSLFSNLHVGRVVGCGPWANLEVPTQVHSMIERFYDSF
ncbi:MAG TPA: alpha/beta hydrolase [Rhabdochlamydiaceae bacterium]|nr:alpha/beta hydrolase [Rhabdochlamydiaceae bacterium]